MKKNWIILFLIIIIAFTLRIYKLDQIPPSLNWDEVSVGYNAFTIANFGKDEWGEFFPLIFTSFGDDKHPVHLYITAIFVKFLDLSDFAVRLPSAIFGTLNVLMMFFLGRRLFKNEIVGLISAFALAFSPYAIGFSRFNHELNFALFFFLLGLELFLKGVESKNKLLPLSFLSFGICFITYNGAKIIVPSVVLLIILLYFNQLKRLRLLSSISLIIVISFIALTFLNPRLLGLARIRQNEFPKDSITSTNLYKEYQSELLGKADIVLNQYVSHFKTDYLFISGDNNKRHSTQIVGQFYKIDSLFLLFGFIFIIINALNIRNGFDDKVKISWILLFLALLAPVPAALTRDAPHAGRAMFMMGSWHLIGSYGFYRIISFSRSRFFKLTFSIVVLSFYILLFMQFLNFYYNDYSRLYAIEWQYGMKQIVKHVQENPNYSQVFMTDISSQPYIFFLYYLKTPLPKFMETVIYNTTQSKDHSLVSSYDKYSFGFSDPVESFPIKGGLYVMTENQYGGLRYKSDFNIEKVVKFPNGADAFYLVSGTR